MHWLTGSEAVEVLTERIEAVYQELDRIVYAAELQSVPDRVNLNLEALRIGQALDFHAAFVDELPKKEHRDKILDFLGRHPKLVNGLIDPASGQIFRVAAKEPRPHGVYRRNAEPLRDGSRKRAGGLDSLVPRQRDFDYHRCPLDSFVDLFLQRFEAGVSKSVEETRKKLLPAAATA